MAARGFDVLEALGLAVSTMPARQLGGIGRHRGALADGLSETGLLDPDANGELADRRDEPLELPSFGGVSGLPERLR
jgi:hypothetical protein